MRRACNWIFAGVVFCCLFAPSTTGQTSGHGERKALDKAVPVYPAIAKNNHIKGVVKIEVVVRANGSVKSTKVLGGNPVLIGAATDAVRRWKFEAGSEETIEVVQLSFFPE